MDVEKYSVLWQTEQASKISQNLCFNSCLQILILASELMKSILMILYCTQISAVTSHLQRGFHQQQIKMQRLTTRQYWRSPSNSFSQSLGNLQKRKQHYFKSLRGWKTPRKHGPVHQLSKVRMKSEIGTESTEPTCSVSGPLFICYNYCLVFLWHLWL